MFYKLFWLSQIQTSYFGGHSVTNYFGHPGDVSTSMYSASQKDISHEKSNWFPSLQGLFLEGCHRLVLLYSAKMIDFRRLL
jgi:hypothetical protein